MLWNRKCWTKGAVALVLGSASVLCAQSTIGPQGVYVEWVGVSGNPVHGTDFEVDSSDPPNVTLKTLAVNGFPIEQWFVGRTPDGSGQPRDLQSVKSAWLTDQANPGIIVRIGRVEGYPVRSITGTVPPDPLVSVHIQRPPVVGGNNPWSSVDIKTVKDASIPPADPGGHVSGSVLVEANTATTPLGGRIVGSIAGNQGVAGSNATTDPRIDVYAIGEGASGSGTLRVDGQLWNARFTQFPAGTRLEARSMSNYAANGPRLRVRGPMNGTIRLGDLMGLNVEAQSAKLVIEGLNLAAGDPPPGSEPRLVSTGNIIIAGGDLTSDIYSCPGGICQQVDTTGWPADPIDPNGGYRGFRNCDIIIEGDWGGHLYVWKGSLLYANHQQARIKIGRSMAEPYLKANLAPGGEIRTFQGNYSSPPTEGAIVDMDIDIFGETQAGSVIEFGGQYGFGRTTNVYSHHGGLFRLMYFYGNYGFSESSNARIHVYGHLFGTGTIQTTNMTDAAQHSCFRDNGTITIEGDVQSGGQILLTGHVGPAHLTEVKGDMFGTYEAGFPGPSHQKKYAGRLHIYGDSTGNIFIRPSMDSMSHGFSYLQAGQITVDGDLTGSMILAGLNAPPCLWKGSIPPADPVACEPTTWDPDTQTYVCSPPSGCAGEWLDGALDPAFCCQGCQCYPLPDLPPPPAPQCDAQTPLDVRENFIQHPGALVSGTVTINGRLIGSIDLSGDIGPQGTLRIVRGIEGGVLTIGG